MSIQVILESIEGEEAVLKVSDGRLIRCPLSLLALPATPGKQLWLTVSENAPSGGNAAEILNEILNPHEGNVEETA